jgi:hypothetical protein
MYPDRTSCSVDETLGVAAALAAVGVRDSVSAAGAGRRRRWVGGAADPRRAAAGFCGGRGSAAAAVCRAGRAVVSARRGERKSNVCCAPRDGRGCACFRSHGCAAARLRCGCHDIGYGMVSVVVVVVTAIFVLTFTL